MEACMAIKLAGLVRSSDFNEKVFSFFFLHGTEADAMAEKVLEYVHLVPQTKQVRALHTVIRDKNTQRGDFVFYSDRLIRLLVEEGLGLLPFAEKVIETPVGPYPGSSRIPNRFLGDANLAAAYVHRIDFTIA
jgi:hypothetical protein